MSDDIFCSCCSCAPIRFAINRQNLKSLKTSFNLYPQYASAFLVKVIKWQNYWVVNILCLKRTISQMGILNNILYRNIFCEQLYGTHNSLTKLLRTLVAVKVRTHLLCTYSVVKGDGWWWQSCRSTSIWFTPGRRLFFIILIRSLSSLVISNSLLLRRLDWCDSGW